MGFRLTHSLRAILVATLCLAASAPAAGQWETFTTFDRMTDQTLHHALVPSLEDGNVGLRISCRNGTTTYWISGLNIQPEKSGVIRIRFDKKTTRAVRADRYDVSLLLQDVTRDEIEASKQLLVVIVGRAGIGDYTFLLDGAATAFADIRKHCPR